MTHPSHEVFIRHVRSAGFELLAPVAAPVLRP